MVMTSKTYVRPSVYRETTSDSHTEPETCAAARLCIKRFDDIDHLFELGDALCERGRLDP